MSRAARYRTFSAVVFPDSENTPDDWVEVLQELHIPVLISPKHEPEEEHKKEHFHVMLDFSGPHLLSDALKIWESIGALPDRDKRTKEFTYVKDKRALARYFCHLDEKDKKKYDISAVTCFSGFDYLTLINLPADKYSAIGEMIDFVQKYNIISFAQLVIYCREYEDEWYRSLCDNSSYFMKEFIKSYFWEQNLLAKNECSRNLSLAKNTEEEESHIE